ncbi:MAG: ribonuclease P protein component [Burkholderiaceae bacterium]|nr:ribonuclease P protein component [Rhodoferax sp.]MCP5284916.1 ribonuclease P protein component [Burkholderiaceae bacterium]
MIGRLVHSADFQRLLSTPAWSRSTHFAVHHLPVPPARPRRKLNDAISTELSTDDVDKSPEPVDDLCGRFWLGAVLPKRLAKRAVTRNLLRRQIRAALQRHAQRLPGGLWVVRLRSGFARSEYVSAASTALRVAARAELDAALGAAGRRTPAAERVPHAGRRGAA